MSIPSSGMRGRAGASAPVGRPLRPLACHDARPPVQAVVQTSCVSVRPSCRHAGSVSACCSAATADVSSSSSSTGAEEGAAPQPSVPTASTWELDFCSRPMLDVRGKKVWELLVCDPEGGWHFSRYFPNNKINSTELKAALKKVLATPGAKKPARVLFFRGQMQTIISRALSDLDIKSVPSRRCFALMRLLDERLDAVYKQDERYSEKAGTMFQLDLAPPADLADALRGEKWAFVRLPLSALKDELAPLEDGSVFGANIPDMQKLGVTDSTMVPGVAVFSRRAQPLAAWTNGLQLACLKADVDRACLLLEVGVRERYKYGAWRRSKAAEEEAVAWEAAKHESKGLHFLAVQTDPDAEECKGIWMLRDAPAPSV